MRVQLKVQGEAKYQGETVSIIDSIGYIGTGKIDCLINYSGPVWVNINELTNVVWFI